ncbi:unnamed protein product [Brassicogethes aeneus]|uniref:Uncharacterized protein n=1 Tax=Brassicogethes aeneus TaxID=1431903 RepID=A0A9P0FB75_BRAAE|nr:unnamed protein product [Brassicogethes aeneus]
MDATENSSVNNRKKSRKTDLEKFIDYLENEPVSKQILIGASVGYIGGALAYNIGKTSVVILGGTIAIVYFASKNGYVIVRHQHVNKKVCDFSKKIQRNVPIWIDKIYELFQTNLNVSCGFYAGFILALMVS